MLHQVTCSALTDKQQSTHQRDGLKVLACDACSKNVRSKALELSVTMLKGHKTHELRSLLACNRAIASSLMQF
jgi:hypothetical protein